MYLGGINREESLSRGTLFDDFTIRMDNRKSGRPKQVFSTKGQGYYTVHGTFFCNKLANVPLNILRIAHFKKIVEYNDRKKESTSLKIYTHSLQKVLKSI